MVAIAIEPCTAGMRTEGITLVFAILLEQVIATENLALSELQGVIVLGTLFLQQIRRNDNLVEQL